MLAAMYRQLIFALAATALVGYEAAGAGPIAPPAQPPRGEFGADLSLLQKHYLPPRHPEESNYFVDLWSDQDLKAFAVSCGIINNHALFVNSHGTGLAT